jgi:Heat induced stress protein YflT
VARSARQRSSNPPVTRVFTGRQAASDAIRALEAAGVDARSISVVTQRPADAETLEHDTGASEDLENASHRDRLSQFVDWLGRVGSVAVPGLGPVLGTGDLWRDIAIAGSGRGSVTGALVGVGVPVDEAADFERAIFEGKILVVVHGAYDPAAAQRVLHPR